MWWSSSAFVRTAISRRELEQRAVGLVGLDHEPLPRPPGRRSCRWSGPRRRPGRTGPARSRAARGRACSTWSSCRGCRRRRSWAAAASARPSRSARCSSRAPRSRRRTRSGLSAGIAVEIDDLGARRGRWRRRARSAGSIPASRSARERTASPRARSEPVTDAPSACATSGEAAHPGAADPHEVQPPAGPGSVGRHGGHPREAAAAVSRIPAREGGRDDPARTASSASRARRSASRRCARASARRSRRVLDRPRRAGGHVDGLGQVGDLPDRRPADARARPSSSRR